MARNNLGKQFEKAVHQSFTQMADVSIDRLRDAPRKLKNVDNPSDFIVYKKPYEVYLECKSHKGNTLPFSCIREEQWNGMLKKQQIEGVKAGVIVWFIDHDLTVFVDISVLARMRASGLKSLNIKDLEYIENIKSPMLIKIEGKKKRIYFDYDMKKFLEDLYQ